MFRGWKTIAFGLLLAVGPQALDHLATIDWASLGLSPNTATVIGLAIMALRAMTSTPIGRKMAIAALLVGGLSLSACSIADADRGKLAAACDAAMSLAPLAAPIAPWIVGGCGSAQAIAKLAEDPGSLVWVLDLVAKARAL